MKFVKATLQTFSLLLVFYSPLCFAAGLLIPKGQSSSLQIIDHKVEVTIENGFAVTSVEQVFRNNGSEDKEAIYSFPVPEQASVGQFSYWINGQPIQGEVLPRQQAKQVYQQQRDQGKSTALVQANGFKTFEISISPVIAGADTRLRLVYLQPVTVDTGIGRYVYPLEEGGVDDAQNNFWSREDKVQGQFSFDLDLRSGYPVDGLRLPQHGNAQITQLNSQRWQASISNQSSSLETELAASRVVSRLDKDIVVYWRHQQGLPGSVDLVSYKAENQRSGTFALTITPGGDLAPINVGRDWIFVLDISGSMQGKYATLVEGVKQGLEKLNSQDRFKIILFNNQAHDLGQDFLAANSDNVTRQVNQLLAFQVGGGTNLYAGLEEALNYIDADRTSAVVLVTDGVANVGITEKTAFYQLLDRNDVRLFTFVMGNSANRPLLQGMAKYSHGFAMNVSNADDIMGQILLATSKVSHQAFHDIKVDIDGVRVNDMQPQVIGSIYRGQQIMIFGHYTGSGLAQIKVQAKISGKSKTYTSQFEFPAVDESNPELQRLWAYASIKSIEQQMDKLGNTADSEQAIQDLALQYGLVSDYTSMLVVEDAQFQHLGVARNNKARVQTEQIARQSRNQQANSGATSNNRVDNKRPMFKAPRPSLGGGHSGAMDWLVWLFLAPMAWLFFKPTTFVNKRVSVKKLNN